MDNKQNENGRTGVEACIRMLDIKILGIALCVGCRRMHLKYVTCHLYAELGISGEGNFLFVYFTTSKEHLQGILRNAETFRNCSCKIPPQDKAIMKPGSQAAFLGTSGGLF